MVTTRAPSKRRLRRGSARRSACGSPSGASTLSSGVETPFGQRVRAPRVGVCALRGEDLEQARGGVDAVVEAVPALVEEDVAAHLAGELARRSRFILALISEWPVFHISGLPPWRRM